jgi:hypothetical protein
VTPAPTSASDDPTIETESVDTSFPKGNAFAQWLVGVGASTMPGQLPIAQTRFNVQSTSTPAQDWVHGIEPGTGAQGPLEFTFITQWDKANDQCGEVLFSDFHTIASTSGEAGPAAAVFPTECETAAMSPIAPMTPQEQALEFMFFDLTACVGPYKVPPEAQQ